MSNKLFAGVLGAVMAVGTGVAPVRAASAGFLDQRDSTKSGQLGEATVSALGVQGSKDKKGIASVSVAGGSVQKSGESGII